MITEINAEWEKSDRLTAKLNTVKQYNKQDHKSKLMTENTIQPPEIEYTQMPQALVLIDTHYP